MSRAFNEDATNDAYEYTMTAGVSLNDALTMLIVVRVMETTDAVWMSFLEGKNAAETEVRAALGRRSNDDIYFTNHIATDSAGSLTDSDNWCIVAATRTSAAATTVHKLPIGGSRTSTAAGTTADGNSMASGILRIGGEEDWANIRVAAAAFWNTTELTTTQLDSILSAKTTQSIADLSPTWLVDDSDAFATNLVNPGVMDRSGTVGAPADHADDPSGWVYGLGGSTDYTGNVTGAAAATASGPQPMVSTLTRPYVLTTIS